MTRTGVMAGAEFTHKNGNCTFEVLVERFVTRAFGRSPRSFATSIWRTGGFVRRVIAVLGLACCVGVPAFTPVHPPLRFVETIALKGVEGRIDHMAVDPQSGRLFVAALGNGTVEVVDLHSAERIKSLRGFHEPQGVGFAANMAA